MRRTDARGPLVTFAATVVIAFVAFAVYAVHRQHITDSRAEAQRKAICAILANIPGRIPPEIMNARRVFARPGHEKDCYPTRKPTPSATPGSAAPTVLFVTPQPSPSPPSRFPPHTASPRPSHPPTPQPSPTRTPTPSLSPCRLPDLLHDPVHCLHL